MTTLAIHQPNLFPRLKVLQKLAQADTWVVLDDVQLAGREWQTRARLRYATDPAREFWLSLPAHRPAGRATLISQVTVVDHARALERLRRSVTYTYRSAPHWGAVRDVLDQVPSTPGLVAITVASTNALLAAAGVKVPTVASSGLQVPGRRVEKLIGICQALGATEYVSGSGGASYSDTAEFTRAGINVRPQDWKAPPTELAWRNVSALDFLARHGPGALEGHLHSWHSATSP